MYDNNPANKPIAERVADGVRLLDESDRPWWWVLGIIDTTTLDIVDGDRCVLGQLFGDYGQGIHEVRVYEQLGGFGTSRLFGFNALTHENHEVTEEWVRVIKARRLAAIGKG